MIEVFKTNINDPEQAQRIIHFIHKKFPGYMANFDLDDCDNILRIQCYEEKINSRAIISLLQDLGFRATILEDIIITTNRRRLLIDI